MLCSVDQLAPNARVPCLILKALQPVGVMAVKVCYGRVRCLERSYRALTVILNTSVTLATVPSVTNDGAVSSIAL